MSGLDIGQVPDRPTTPTDSEASANVSDVGGEWGAKPNASDVMGDWGAAEPSASDWGVTPRATRAEDVEDGDEEDVWGESKDSNTKSKSSSRPRAPKDKAPRDKATAAKSKVPTGYVRPENAKKEKMSPEELAAVMEKMKLQNDKIRQQRERIEADEDAFHIQVKEERERQKKLREEQRAKDAAQRKIQENINQEREANAKRKLEKMAQREWDSQKKDTPPRKERPFKGLGRSAGKTERPEDDDKPGKTAKRERAPSPTYEKSKSPTTPEEPPQLPELSLGHDNVGDEWETAAPTW